MRCYFLLSTLFFGCVLVPAATAETNNHKHRQLVHMERTAQVGPEYQALAAGYSGEAAQFDHKAEGQRAAYREALEHPVPGGKYPNAADTSIRLAEYYQSRADQARAKQKLYERKVK